ncbi:MAG TPA: M56 family metallopeptidase [Nannocystis sp.]
MTCSGALLWLASLQAAGAAVFAVAALIDLGLRRRPAATRRALWVVAITCALALPLTRLALPAPQLALAPAPAAVLLSVWTAGALVLLVRLLRAHAAARRLVARSRPLTDPAWHACLAELRGPRARLELRVSTDVDTLLVAGVLRPAILVPARTLAAPPDERRALLAHELAHVARADTLLLLAGAIARTIYWITPAPWYALRRLRAHAEDAADDAALRTGIPSSSYAARLVAVARDRFARAGNSQDPANSPLIPAGGLRERIRAVLDVRRLRSLAPENPRELPRLVAAALLLATMVTACEARADEPVTVTAASARGPRTARRPPARADEPVTVTPTSAR